MERNKPSSGFYTTTDLMSPNIKSPKWLIENFIRQKCFYFFAGEPASLKSFFALFLALKGNVDNKLYNKYKCLKFNTLIIDEENRDFRLKERFTKLLNGHNLKNYEEIGIHFLIDEEFHFNFRADYEPNLDVNLGDEIDKRDSEERRVEALFRKIKQYIIENDVKLLILDSLVRMVPGNENDAHIIREVHRKIKSIINECDCAVIMIHHTRKTKGMKGRDDVRGSVDIIGQVDDGYVFNEIDKKSKIFQIDSVKGRDGNFFKSIRVQIKDVPEVMPGQYDYTKDKGVIIDYLGEVEQNIGEKPKKMTAPEKLVEKILVWIKNNPDEQRISMKIVRSSIQSRISNSTFYGAKDILVAERKLSELKPGLWKIERETYQKKLEHISSS